MRAGLRRKPWLFWGEKIVRRGGLHDWLSAPLRRAAGLAVIGTVAERDYRDRFPEARIFNIPYHCDLDPFLAITTALLRRRRRSSCFADR